MGAGVGDGRNPSDRRLFAKGGKYAHSGGAKAGDQVDQVDGCRRGEGRVVGEYLAFSDDTVRQGGDFYFCTINDCIYSTKRICSWKIIFRSSKNPN